MTTTHRQDRELAAAREDPADRLDTAVDCAVVVVTYNSAVDVRELLASLPQAAGGRTVRVTVVDNGSTDDIAAAVAPFDGVHLVQAGANLGYAGGINLAAQHLPSSRWVLVLNPDLVLAPGTVERLVSAAERSSAAAAVPRLVDEQGLRSPSLRREPSVLRSLGEALLGDHAPGRPGWLAEMVRDPGAYEREGTVDWATGAALLVQRAAWSAAGPWDTRFFLYSEETDFFRRIRERGGVVLHVPGAVVRHRGAGSGTSLDLVALLAVNRVRYYRKWHGSAGSALFGLVAVLHCLLRARRPEERRALRALLSDRARRQLPSAPRELRRPVEDPPRRGRAA